MKNFNKILLVIMIFTTYELNAQQLAFPSAEGFGKYASGGRNGTVYHVTNLNDTGPGSLRDAVSAPDRIVVFDVGGVINITDRIVIHKNVTVAGQTAPGDGIVIYGNGIALNDDSGNSIIRYIRIRMGKNGDSGKDAVGISAGTNYMFDHVSVSWGRDGTFDINGSGIDDISIQDCIISQGINNSNHSTGGLMQSGKFSVIRTLWIDNKTRNPKGRGPIEFINSVLYSWREHGFIMGDTEGVSECNLIGNYFISGPESAADSYITGTTPSFALYPSDNWLDDNKDGTLNGTELSAAGGGYKTATIKSTPFGYYGVNTLLSASDAVDHIISHAGASLSRDAVDKMLIEQLSSFGTLGGIIDTEDDNGISGGVGIVNNGTKPLDTDGDGMPDAWEDSNGTNKSVDDAMTISVNGYANIENYVNSINEALPFLKYPVNISGSAISPSEILLEWTNVEDSADQLIIEYGVTVTDFTDTITIAGDAISTTITGLQSGTTYHFRIMAVNSSLESAYSEVVSVQTEAVAIPPVACSSPSPANAGTFSFLDDAILTWDNTTTDLGGTLYYDVYFGKSLETMIQVATHQTKKSHFVGALDVSQTYYWRVSVSNDLGSTAGDTWSFTTASESKDRVLYIPFDETSGYFAQNLAGPNDANAFDMTPSWEPGIKGNCLYFDAFVEFGSMVVPSYSEIEMGTSPFTISLWYKSSVGDIPDSYLFHKGTHSVDHGPTGTGKWIGIQYVAGNRLTFAIDDNSTKTDLNITSPDQYFDGEWHHFVGMRDVSNDLLKVYIDGVKIGEKTDNTGDITEIAELVLGNNNFNFNNPFLGSLDELEIYNDALSDDEVTYLYNNTPASVFQASANPLALHVYPNPFTNILVINTPDEIARIIYSKYY